MKMISSTKQATTLLALTGLAFIIGALSGLMAMLFRHLIGIFHNALFLKHFSLHYNSDIHTPQSHLGIWIILVPVLGGIIVTWIVKTFAPEAKGHGVPEVIHAIHCKNGHLRPVVVIAKALASALTIGSGGSVGREGPIVQICSAIGSVIGSITKASTERRIIFVAAGASAGIAATFNAPLGGLAFAIELMLIKIDSLSIMLVVIATATATYLGRFLVGLKPAFNIPELAIPDLHLANPYVLPLFAILGIIFGFAAVLFIRLLYRCEDAFKHIPGNDYLRHGLGMLIIGIVIYSFMHTTGYYYIDGVGYATIMDILRGLLYNYSFLLLLFFAKLLATCVTIGSGGSGGIFSPSLFLGATLGAACGGFFDHILPGLNISPLVFAVAGMAAMVSGTTGASLTAIIMTVEMTRDYNAILPIMLSAAIAHCVRLRMQNESIYTLKLARRGIRIKQGLQAMGIER